MTVKTIIGIVCILGVIVWLVWLLIYGKTSKPLRICSLHGGDSFARCEKCRRVYCYKCWPDEGDCAPHLGDEAWKKRDN